MTCQDEQNAERPPSVENSKMARGILPFRAGRFGHLIGVFVHDDANGLDQYDQVIEERP